jgi:hypothetical protein
MIRYVYGIYREQGGYGATAQMSSRCFSRIVAPNMFGRVKNRPEPRVISTPEMPSRDKTNWHFRFPSTSFNIEATPKTWSGQSHSGSFVAFLWIATWIHSRIQRSNPARTAVCQRRRRCIWWSWRNTWILWRSSLVPKKGSVRMPPSRAQDDVDVEFLRNMALDNPI